MSKKKIYYQLWIEGFEDNKATIEAGKLEGTFDESINETYCIMRVLMTEQEFESLPPFKGF